MKTYRAKIADIEMEASLWLARLGDGDPESRTPAREDGFAAWLRQSPAHVQAFLEASDAFYRLDALTPDLATQVRQPLGGPASNVTTLPASGAMVRKTGRSTWRFPAAAAIAASMLGAALLVWNGHRTEAYTTGIGEQRTVRLEDGSLVHLNTQSRMSLQFSEEARQITLLEGEALFTVEHDPARPFLVRTDDALVRAVGTAFNVYRRGSEVQVAVIDGRVQVSAKRETGSGTQPDTALEPVLLDAGEEAHVANGRVSRKTGAAVDAAIAWRERRLVFKDTPLAQVAAEFNRYNTSQLRIEGESLRSRPLTGIFSADHPQSLILYLAEHDALEVTRAGEDWVVSGR